MKSSDSKNVLLEWCKANSVWIDERVHIRNTTTFSHHHDRDSESDNTPELEKEQGSESHYDYDSTQPEQLMGFSVFNGHSLIPPNTTLVKISKNAVLSVRSCSLAEHISFVPFGLGAQLSLSLALYGELLLRTHSRWFGYLQSLPKHIVDLPLFWGVGVDHPIHLHRHTKFNSEDKGCSKDKAYSESEKLGGSSTHTSDTIHDACSSRRNDRFTSDDKHKVADYVNDGIEALSWLRGTEAEKTLRSREEGGKPFLEQLDAYFYAVVRPTISEYLVVKAQKAPLISTPTLAGFYHAFSLVSSRAFMVDAYHGLSMVPIADAFNHTVDNHVHLESDFNVCPECGSLYECPHDREDPPPFTTTTNQLLRPLHPSHSYQPPRSADHASISTDSHDECYEMVSNAPIPPHTEIFNTYGESLTNAELLDQYGFVLDVNENDRVGWSRVEALSTVVGGGDRGVHPHPGKTRSLDLDLEWVLGLLKTMGVTDEDLFYFADDDDEGEDTLTKEFVVNAEGKVDAPLWALLFVLASTWSGSSAQASCLEPVGVREAGAGRCLDVLGVFRRVQQLLGADLDMDVDDREEGSDLIDIDMNDPSIRDDGQHESSMHRGELQYRVEEHEGSDEDLEEEDRLNLETFNVVIRMCASMRRLCRVRLRNSGKQGLTERRNADPVDEATERTNESAAEDGAKETVSTNKHTSECLTETNVSPTEDNLEQLDLNDVMDSLPDHQTRTRLALSVLMSERAILNCCEAAWTAVGGRATGIFEERRNGLSRDITE